MTTLEIGQLVEQTGTGRIWRIESEASAATPHRWWIVLTQPGPGDVRGVQERTTASSAWLQRTCVDWSPPVIDPPCGDGVQVMCIVAEGEVVERAIFTTVTAMLEWTAGEFDRLIDAEFGTEQVEGRWYGWEADLESPPDMTVSMNTDGELVWAEA